ncbi:nucleotidyltransferase [Thermococcus celericrescens]|uniref:Nucleotidyltransferase n=1 Tax=Thermococcus celericrescens TaxID=227598 RepID=A0A124EBN5_9EURY|nr:nucleotidyltransferase domain-containing protein [Thermococcus celericrescens]KUH34707.1 nucleotidyltransferase [Thermococcus celericrescens]
MRDWKQALEKFMGEWRKRDFVEAALLTGSYAVGLETERSDVDVYIILSDDVDWRERGNVVVDGILIEYFVNPARQIRRYFEKELSQNSRSTARIVTIGKVLFDKTGITETLKMEAREYMETPFERPDETWVEVAKYSLWDALDSLKDAEERSDPSYAHIYHLALRRALEVYSKFLGLEVPPASKVYRLFSDETFRRAYLFPDFPDGRFVEPFLRALEEVKTENLEAIIAHVFDEMGGFDIDGWRLRTRVEV